MTTVVRTPAATQIITVERQGPPGPDAAQGLAKAGIIPEPTDEAMDAHYREVAETAAAAAVADAVDQALETSVPGIVDQALEAPLADLSAATAEALARTEPEAIIDGVVAPYVSRFIDMGRVSLAAYGGATPDMPDCTDGLTNFFAYLKANGGRGYVPSGRYHYSGGLTIDRDWPDGVSIEFEEGAVLVPDLPGPSTYSIHWLEPRNITIKGTLHIDYGANSADLGRRLVLRNPNRSAGMESFDQIVFEGLVWQENCAASLMIYRHNAFLSEGEQVGHVYFPVGIKQDGGLDQGGLPISGNGLLFSDVVKVRSARSEVRNVGITALGRGPGYGFQFKGQTYYSSFGDFYGENLWIALAVGDESGQPSTMFSEFGDGLLKDVGGVLLSTRGQHNTVGHVKVDGCGWRPAGPTGDVRYASAVRLGGNSHDWRIAGLDIRGYSSDGRAAIYVSGDRNLINLDAIQSIGGRHPYVEWAPACDLNVLNVGIDRNDSIREGYAPSLNGRVIDNSVRRTNVVNLLGRFRHHQFARPAGGEVEYRYQPTGLIPLRRHEAPRPNLGQSSAPWGVAYADQLRLSPRSTEELGNPARLDGRLVHILDGENGLPTLAWSTGGEFFPLPSERRYEGSHGSVSLQAASTLDVTMTVSGVRMGDLVRSVLVQDLPPGLIYSNPRVVADNSIVLRLANITGAPIATGALTYAFFVRVSRLHPRTTALLGRFANPPPAEFVPHLNRAMIALDERGFFDKLDVLRIWALFDAQQATRNVISNSHAASLVNSPTHVPGIGLYGDGVAAHANWGYSPAAANGAYQLNSSTVIQSVRGPDNRVSTYSLGQVGGTSLITLLNRTPGGLCSARLNSGATISAPIDSVMGVVAATRVDDTVTLYHNGEVVAEEEFLPATGLPGNNLTTLRHQSSSYSNKLIEWEAAGAYLDQEEIADLSSIMEDLCAAARAYADPEWVHPATAQLLGRFTSPAPEPVQVAINAVVKRWHDAGIWSRIDLVQFHCLHDPQASTRNWVSGIFNAVLVNTPTHTSYRGFRGDGISSYLRTDYAPSQNAFEFGLDDGAFAVGQGDPNWDGGALLGQLDFTGGQRMMLWPRSSPDLTAFRLNSNMTHSVDSGANTSGVWLVETDGTEVAIWRDGDLLATVPYGEEEARGLSGRPLTVLFQNGNYYTGLVTMTAVTSRLTEAQRQEFFDLSRLFIQAMESLAA